MPQRKRRGKERRKFRRLDIQAAEAAVHLTADATGRGVERVTLRSEDVSPEGVFLRTERDIPRGQILTIDLHLPSMASPLRCQAKVVRLELQRSGTIHGVGLRFVEFTDAQRAQLLEHLYRSFRAQQRPA